MTLWAQQLACTRGTRALFDGLDLELQRGDALRVAGDNGAGKTSLLRILCGLARPCNGTVYWNSEDIRSMRESYHRQLTWIGHLPGIKDDLSACENVMLVTRLSGNRVDRNAALSALEQFGLARQADLPARVLSQGQRKRVALARLPFCSATPLWILDEPLAGLDLQAIAMLTETLERHLEHHGMLVYSTHQELTLQARRNMAIELFAPC